jgi:hypothetical protein
MTATKTAARTRHSCLLSLHNVFTDPGIVRNGQIAQIGSTGPSELKNDLSSAPSKWSTARSYAGLGIDGSL